MFLKYTNSIIFQNVLFKLNHNTKCKRFFGEGLKSLCEVDLLRKEIRNEKNIEYTQNSQEFIDLQKELVDLPKSAQSIPVVIGGKEIETKQIHFQICPFDHKVKLAKYHYADQKNIEDAIAESVRSQEKWDKTKWLERISIFEKAADLMSSKYRYKMMATIMLGQGKTIMQAEKDLSKAIDVLRINSIFLTDILKHKPLSPKPLEYMNYDRLRGCEGFWAAMTPFNSVATAVNLISSPILMGNAVLWKPSPASILSNWKTFEILKEAGLPDGVLNFIPTETVTFSDTITNADNLAGINYSGSSRVFNTLWSKVGSNVEKYKNYPHMIGDLLGKNYHFVHPSADPKCVINETIRSAFEFSGQKSSACSNIYIPNSLFENLKTALTEAVKKIAICHPTRINSFTSSVISKRSYEHIQQYIAYAKSNENLKILVGGCCDDTVGYYIEPTIIQCKNLEDKIMKDVIFGPILVVHVYEDKDIDKILKKISKQPFARTGSIFTKDEEFLMTALEVLKMSASNIYINDKSTGSIIGQNVHGGSRHSGTSDTIGSKYSLLRYANPQSIKLNKTVIDCYNYSYMKCIPDKN